MTNIAKHEPGPEDALLPREPGLRAHVLRVAALARDVASAIGLPADQRRTVERAARLHHLQSQATGAPVAERLLADLGIDSLPSDSVALVPVDVAEIVKVHRRPDQAPNGKAAHLATILESANLFDEQMENLPYEDEVTGVIINQLLDSEMLIPEFVESLREVWRCAKKTLLEAASQLPAFSEATTEGLRIADEPHSRTIAAAAFQPCFDSGGLEQLWKHSLDAGENAAAMARLSGVDEGEAYLAGLLHDVGRVAFELSGQGISVRKWEQEGFPTVYAEMLSAGTDHAEIGADILARWNFADSLVEAVRFHHRPELVGSKLAAILYAIEDVDESLPSLARDHTAAKRLEVASMPRSHAAG